MSSSADSAADNRATRAAPLRVICGPTGAGKSAIAMTLAARHGLTIVSADSRQLYRGFDIGTAKPSRADRLRVPHVGVDVADPGERWSAARFAGDAIRAIDAAGADNVVIVGGTGFYLRALVAPLDPVPPIDAARRAALADELRQVQTDTLRRWVRVLDPRRAEFGRAQLMRAAEVALLTGRRLSDSHSAESAPSRFDARYLVVDPGPALHPQIANRLDAMLAAGWADEVRALELVVPVTAPAWQACGYSTMRDLVAGTLESAVARNAILIATRQYAKRQRTWFRHQLDETTVTRVDPHDPSCDDVVEQWWRGGTGE